MKKQMRRLGLIFRFTMIKPEMFYSVTFRESEITLQGYFNPVIVGIAKNLKMEMRLSGCNYLEFTRGNITITLTEK